MLAQICIESLSDLGLLKRFNAWWVLDIFSDLLFLPTPISRHSGLLLFSTPDERKTSQPQNDCPESDRQSTKPRSL